MTPYIDHGILDSNKTYKRSEPSLEASPKLDFSLDNAKAVTNLVLLFVGFPLNLLLLLVVTLDSRLRTSSSCYVLSFVISDFVVLFAVLRDVLDVWFHAPFLLDIDYATYVTFEACILTLTVFSLDRYVVIFDRPSRISWSHVPTAVKNVLGTWVLATMTTAMELNLRIHFKRDTFTYIYFSSTLIFLGGSIIVLVLLNALIVSNLKSSEVGLTPLRREVVDDYLVLVALIFGFFATMVPHRLATAVNYADSTLCSVHPCLDATFTTIAMSSLVFPVLCFAASKTLRERSTRKGLDFLMISSQSKIPFGESKKLDPPFFE